MSSLKQRAKQCSGYIPASQYVPVYSRPHRSNQARWHEEIAPISPKPTLDDPFSTRSQSIHEAVKMWLDSSPSSVIGPLYRSGSPSSSSPPSNGESIEQHQQRAKVTTQPPGEANRSDTSHRESQNDRFYDVGSGGLSPQQISIEQSGLASGSSASSPMPAERVQNSTSSWATRTNRALDVGAAPLPLIQESGAKSPEHVPSKDDEKSNSRDAVPPSIPEGSWACNQVPSLEEEASTQSDEGTNSPSLKRRGGKKRPNSELKSPGRERLYGLSVGSLSDGSLSDFNSLAVSREFDTALALVVNDIDRPKPIDTLSCISDYSSVVGAHNVLLKPPRGLEKSLTHDAEQNSNVAELSSLPRAASARQDQYSETMTILPLPGATNAREDQNSGVTRTPLFYRLGGTERSTTERSTSVADEAKADTNSEIVPVCDPEIVEDVDNDNISVAKQSPLTANASERRKGGYRANLKKIDEVAFKNETPDSPHHLTIQGVLQIEDKWETEEAQQAQQAQQTKVKSRDSSPVVVSNGVAAVDGGYEFRQDRPIRRTPSHYSEGGSVTSAPSSVNEQHIYQASPLHYMISKMYRSKKQNAVAPAESPQQLRKSKSRKSSERGESPIIEVLDKAKLEELRIKADAWETAKNVAILNRFEREERKIFAWEERKVAKATLSLRKMESDLEKKRAMVAEKMQYEVAQAHKKAAEMKAHAEAKRAERAAKVAVQAQVLRVIGNPRFSLCFS